MDFDHSSQKKNWLFDKETLSFCRQQRASINSARKNQESSQEKDTKSLIESFASGYHHRTVSSSLFNNDNDCDDDTSKSKPSNSLTNNLDLGDNNNEVADACVPELSLSEQETIIRFHANQICKLVGPSALFPKLRRSPNVVSTAIILFRRFYLSNNLLAFDCRQIATAASFLASKVEEQRVDIEYLAYATESIYRKARETPLYCSELRSVSVGNIKSAERALMKGINYEMICFHPTETTRVLACDLSKHFEECLYPGQANHAYHLGEYVHSRAQAVCYRASVCSDAPFLFGPDKIAFAATKIAFQANHHWKGLSSDATANFLRSCMPTNSALSLESFEKEVDAVVDYLKECPQMELVHHNSWKETEELSHALMKLGSIRSYQPPVANKRKCDEIPTTTNETYSKRFRMDSHYQQSEKVVGWNMLRNCPEVTPISQQ